MLDLSLNLIDGATIVAAAAAVLCAGAGAVQSLRGHVRSAIAMMAVPALFVVAANIAAAAASAESVQGAVDIYGGLAASGLLIVPAAACVAFVTVRGYRSERRRPVETSVDGA